MRPWLVLLPLLLAGCTQPSGAPTPTSAPGTSALPPSLVVDRTTDGHLLVFIHAKLGNVRYEHINVTVDGAPLFARADSYSLEDTLPGPAANLTVAVVEGDVHYNWTARMAVNLTAKPPTLAWDAWDRGAWSPQRNVTLPFEKLLPREESS